MAKTTKNTAPKADVQERITAVIIAGLEAAKGPTEWPWVKAAQQGAPINIVSGKPYKGINRMVLGMLMQGGASRYWATFKQWKDAGARINSGEPSTLVVKWNDCWLDKDGKKVAPHTEGAKKILWPVGFLVWHSGQVSGWNEPAKPNASTEAEQLAAAAGADELDEIEAFVQGTGAIVHDGGDRAFYMPGMDQIQMPDRDRFKDTATGSATTHYYGTLMHELIHWTGIKKRCDRDLTGKFGSNSYAFEELVAEIGSAFLCADLGISPEPRADNISYVANWLQVLKDDKKAIFTASSLSGKATEYLHGLQDVVFVTADSDEAEEVAEAA